METNELQDNLDAWFAGLDYQYMILQTLVCYGLYYSDNWRWIVEWFSPVRKKGRSKAVWLFGGILILVEASRYAFTEDGLSYINVTSLFYSFVLIQVFVDTIVEYVHKLIKKIT